ncbi:MAG: polysaccharide pyruvyl transferase family protein [Actinomycetota bacterium]
MIPNQRETARAFLDPRAPVYVGATTNRSNVGDDLLLVAHQELLGTPAAILPMGGNDRLLRLRLLRSGTLPLLLGGGTLIGRPAYRRAFESATARAGSGLSLSMLGPGVSAPDETGKSSLDELRAWAPLLDSFPEVRVRGPRSAAHLARVGVESTVVGDPVLSLMRPFRREQPAPRPPHVVLNAADVTGMDTATTVIAEAIAAVAAVQPDLEVSVVSAADYDDQAAASLAAALPAHARPADVVRLSGATPRQVAAQLAATVAVPIRLHVGVCAVALDVPTIALGYEDKCDDFFDSVHHPESHRRTPATVESGWLAERIVQAIDGSAPATTGAVDRLVTAQGLAAMHVRAELGLASV